MIAGVIVGALIMGGAFLLGFFLGRSGKLPGRSAAFLLAISGLSTISCGFEIVDTGHRGVKTRFGKVASESLDEGLHYYNPFTSDIHELDVRETKLEGTTDAFTKDTQTVKVSYSVTYYPEKTKMHEMYQQYGKDWAEKIIPQVVLGSLKDAIGRYIADDLVARREETKNAAETELKDNLAKRNILVTRLDLVNLDFDDAYERAVEEKVIAIQNAAKARNKTVEVLETAKQTVATARADAEAMKIKSEALKQNKGLTQYEAIKRWNGELPRIMFGGSGALPMVNLNDLNSIANSKSNDNNEE